MSKRSSTWKRKVKNQLRRRGQRACYYCKVSRAHMTLDHKIPVSEGGGNMRGNLVLCCYQCNQAKGSMNAVEFMEFLERQFCPEIPDDNGDSKSNRKE